MQKLQNKWLIKTFREKDMEIKSENNLVLKYKEQRIIGKINKEYIQQTKKKQN